MAPARRVDQTLPGRRGAMPTSSGHYEEAQKLELASKRKYG
jgi:hypothetical protein